MYLGRKITTKWKSNQLKHRNVNSFTYKINVSVQFATVSLSVCDPREA